MENGIIQKIQDTLDKNETIGIVVGKNPSLDEMAGALSLYLSFKADGKRVVVACPTEPIVENSSLVGIDKVKTFFSSDKGDLIVSFPYAEGDIEKVSYTLEEGSLNIIIKGGTQGLSFSEKDVRYKRAGGVPQALFVVGTPRLSDLGDLFDPESLKNTTIINIDNKQDNQGFGDVVFVSPVYSSVSEQAAHILMSLAYPLDVDIAQNLFSGIHFATDNFQHPKTSPTAFEIAGQLLRKGATRKQMRLKQNPEVSGFPQFSGQKMQGRNDVMPHRDTRGFRPKAPSPFPRGQTMQNPSYSNPPSGFTPKNPQPLPVIERKDDPKQEQADDAPPDWLTPKVYKGSTIV